MRNRNDYIDVRVEGDKRRQKFKEFLERQRQGINDNYLMIFFLTQLYNRGRLDLQSQMTEQEIIRLGINWFVLEHAKERNPGLLAELSRKYGLSEEEKIEEKYLEEMKPSARKIATYMTANDKPVVPIEDVQKILDDRWNLVTELQFRRGRRRDRFITDKEYEKGIRASTYKC